MVGHAWGATAFSGLLTVDKALQKRSLMDELSHYGYLVSKEWIDPEEEEGHGEHCPNCHSSEV